MYIVEQINGGKIEVEIIKAVFTDLPLKKEHWNFNWKEEFKNVENEIYILRQLNKSGRNIESIISLKWVTQNGENHKHLKMNLLEIAPHNFGKSGKYSRVAGCLLAFACEMSFTVKNNYKGWLMFEAKTELVDLYINKYGAEPTRLPFMCFSAKASIALIDKYLN